MLTSKNSDAHWKKFGETDPYFGVLSDQKYHLNNLTDETREEFFASGRDYVKHVSQVIRDHIAAQFQPIRALDFGCGVGRLVIPFGELAKEVVGVDISEAMLNEARQNCAARDVSNVILVKGDDHLSLLSGEFNLINSVIVFQHIPSARGITLIQRLLALLNDQGVIILQFPYRAKSSTRIANQVFQVIPLLAGFYNLLKHRPFAYPIMQANCYDLNSMIHLFQLNGCANCYIESNTDRYFENVTLYAQKTV